jgi:hypothetical protein
VQEEEGLRRIGGVQQLSSKSILSNSGMLEGPPRSWFSRFFAPVKASRETVTPRISQQSFNLLLRSFALDSYSREGAKPRSFEERKTFLATHLLTFAKTDDACHFIRCSHADRRDRFHGVDPNLPANFWDLVAVEVILNAIRSQAANYFGVDSEASL